MKSIDEEKQILKWEKRKEDGGTGWDELSAEGGTWDNGEEEGPAGWWI